MTVVLNYSDNNPFPVETGLGALPDQYKATVDAMHATNPADADLKAYRPQADHILDTLTQLQALIDDMDALENDPQALQAYINEHASDIDQLMAEVSRLHGNMTSTWLPALSKPGSDQNVSLLMTVLDNSLTEALQWKASFDKWSAGQSSTDDNVPAELDWSKIVNVLPLNTMGSLLQTMIDNSQAAQDYVVQLQDWSADIMKRTQDFVTAQMGQQNIITREINRLAALTDPNDNEFKNKSALIGAQTNKSNLVSAAGNNVTTTRNNITDNMSSLAANTTNQVSQNNTNARNFLSIYQVVTRLLAHNA